MTSLVLTISETLRYRGSIGQWSWVLHRLTGLGVVFFLTLHVIDTSWAVFYPDLYVHAIAAYQSPLFTLGEFGLVAAVIYHALNGIRIVLIDFRPKWWKYQQRAALIVLGLTGILLIPTFILMFGHVIKFYGENPQTLGLLEVLTAQAPFIAGFAVAIIAALLFSLVFGLIAGNKNDVRVGKGRGSRLERFWWSFMRVSGVMIVPLVFGHLAMVHLIQGVFDITVANFTVVGTDVVNQTGTAVEFVASRWNYQIFGAIAIWRLYDIALLSLAVIHGFNGLRYVLTDYTMGNAVLRRAAVYLCVIGAVILLVLGAGALLGTIDESAIEVARQAAENLHR